MICKLQASTTVPPEKELPIALDLKAGWAPALLYSLEKWKTFAFFCVCEFNLILPGGKVKRFSRCLINKHAMKPCRGNGCSDPLILNFRSRFGLVVSLTPPTALTQAKQLPMHPLLGQDFCIRLCCAQTYSWAHPVPFTSGTGTFILGKGPKAGRSTLYWGLECVCAEYTFVWIYLF